MPRRIDGVHGGLWWNVANMHCVATWPLSHYCAYHLGASHMYFRVDILLVLTYKSSCRLAYKGSSRLDSLTSHINRGRRESLHSSPFELFSLYLVSWRKSLRFRYEPYEEIWVLEERSLLELDPRELLGFTHVKKTSMMITLLSFLDLLMYLVPLVLEH